MLLLDESDFRTSGGDQLRFGHITDNVVTLHAVGSAESIRPLGTNDREPPNLTIPRFSGHLR
jgi:hypothetical protein